MQKNNEIVENPKIVKQKQLNNKLLTLEAEIHRLKRQCRLIEAEIVKNW